MIVFGIKFENNHYSKSICQYHKYIFWILQWGNGLDQVEPPVVKDHDPFSMSLWRSVWPLTFILALQNGFKLDFNCLCLLDNYLFNPAMENERSIWHLMVSAFSRIYGPKTLIKNWPRFGSDISFWIYQLKKMRWEFKNDDFWKKKSNVKNDYGQIFGQNKNRSTKNEY